ncbi:MAG: proprotein convertase P-domain-containing protein [Planctomycetota bacterium]|nr:proprotein convertase P-domain-containing protein [Planctomycetota bacterium]
MHQCRPCLRLICLTVGLFAYERATDQSVFAQPGIREALLRLDKNEDGQISPDEITARARPYFERITDRQSGSWREKPISIERLQNIIRVYYSRRNGSWREDIRPGGEQTIIPFGPKRNEPMVPDFGLPYIKYRYNKGDLVEAGNTMRRYDANRDGFVDVVEASRNRWTNRDPFEMDLNKDGRLSLMELAQRYARRRMLDRSSGEIWRKAGRTGGLVSKERRVRRIDSEERRRRDEARWRGNRLSGEIMGRFDANRNGRLEYQEAAKLGFPANEIDVDVNGEITREELQDYLNQVQAEASAAVEGLPDWFTQLDKNRDGQVAMAEYTKEWTNEKLTEFSSYDSNRDGLITTEEALQPSAQVVEGRYANDEAIPMPPGKTIISEIEISDDFPIADVNLQLSITHSFVHGLHAFLTGPDGQRIELFTEVGGRDDHFDGTLFDDQAETPITKARPPFRGSHKPEATDKRQPSLSAFNGKSVQGVWQLIVRNTRNDRFGVLHNWALYVKRQEPKPEKEGGDSAEKTGKSPSQKNDPPQQQAASAGDRGREERGRESRRSDARGRESRRSDERGRESRDR